MSEQSDADRADPGIRSLQQQMEAMRQAALRGADKSVSQLLTELLGTDDWVVVSQGHKGLFTDADLDGLEASNDYRPIMHAPWPGPMYWDHRCRICSEPVDDHANWWQRLMARRTRD